MISNQGSDIVKIYEYICRKIITMAVYNTYVQQISFDGTTYTKGTVVDLLETFNIISQDFPFKKNPKPKDLPTRDWAGADGLDVYVPEEIPMKSYDIDVTFLYVGTEPNIRTDISNFLDYIYGRVGANGAFKSGRLCIYNEHVGMGRKDIVVSDVDNEIFYCSEYDSDAVAKFKVKFTVYDPTTDVTPTYGTYDGEQRCTELNFD